MPAASLNASRAASILVFAKASSPRRSSWARVRMRASWLDTYCAPAGSARDCSVICLRPEAVSVERAVAPTLPIDPPIINSVAYLRIDICSGRACRPADTIYARCSAVSRMGTRGVRFVRRFEERHVGHQRIDILCAAEQTGAVEKGRVSRRRRSP